MLRRLMRRSTLAPDCEALEPRLLLSASWTFLVYVDGDNNLEAAAVDDINEMEFVGSTEDVNIVVQVDRIAGFDASNGNWTDTRRGRIISDSSRFTISSPLTSVGELNMGHPQTLSDFITWGVTTYPADKYALVLWDHGGGITGAAWDDTDNDNLSVGEISSALSTAGTHLDLIAYDMCLMSMLEPVYQVSPFADVHVGSEANEPYDGWPYDDILAELVADPMMTSAQLGQTITEQYNQSYSFSQTQSAVDLTLMPAFATALDNFAQTVISEDDDWDVIEYARNAANWFTYSTYRDLGDFIDSVAANADNPAILADALALQAAYDDLIIANQSSAQFGATGLSVYLPGQSETVIPAYTAGNYTLLADTSWEEFLLAFTGSTPSAGNDVDGTMTLATLISGAPETFTGNIGLDGGAPVGAADVDFYKMEVQAGQRFGFDVDAVEQIGGSTLDGVLRLFNSAGQELRRNDDAYDPDTSHHTYDPYIEHTFDKSGWIYVAVSGYSNWNYDPSQAGSGASGSTGSYTFKIRQIGAEVTDFNGTIPTATILGEAPTVYNGEIGDEPVAGKDVDIYQVTVESNQLLTITVEPSGGLSPRIRLFDPDGVQLAVSSAGATTLLYDFSGRDPGNYYVGVSGDPNTGYDPFGMASGVAGSLGPYHLSIEGTSVHLDFNGVIPRAETLGTLPTTVSAALGDEPVGGFDVDFYSFQVDAGDAFGFDIDALEPGAGADAVLRLFNSAGTELYANDVGEDPDTGYTQDPYFEYTFGLAGTYFIAVSGAPNDEYMPFLESSGVTGDTGAYDLLIRPTISADDYNGSIATASIVASLPAFLSAEIGDESAGGLDVDVYAFTVSAGRYLSFDVDAYDFYALPDSMLRLFDADGNELAANDDSYDFDLGLPTHDSYLAYQFDTAGTYYIAVSGYSNGDYDPHAPMSGTIGWTGAYTLEIDDFAYQDLNGTIPAAIATGAMPFTFNSEIGDESSSGFDVDMFAFTVIANQLVQFDIDADESGSSLDSVLRLFDANGHQLAVNDDGEDPESGFGGHDSAFTYQFAEAGTYYLGVSGYSNLAYDPMLSSSGVYGSTGVYSVHITSLSFLSPQVTDVVANINGGMGLSDWTSLAAGITRLDIDFTEPVTFDAGAVTLETVTIVNGQETVTGTIIPASVAGSGSTHMSVILPAGAVTHSWLRVTLKASAITDGDGNALDGDAPLDGSGRGYLYSEAVDLPSGDGLAGGNAVFFVGALCGDASGNAMVDLADLSVLGATWNATVPNPRADIDGNGLVDLVDLSLLAANWGGPGHGGADIDADGVVDLTDLSILAGEWGQVTSSAAVDFDANGLVDLTDLSLLAAGWGIQLGALPTSRTTRVGNRAAAPTRTPKTFAPADVLAEPCVSPTVAVAPVTIRQPVGLSRSERHVGRHDQSVSTVTFDRADILQQRVRRNQRDGGFHAHRSRPAQADLLTNGGAAEAFAHGEPTAGPGDDLIDLLAFL